MLPLPQRKTEPHSALLKAHLYSLGIQPSKCRFPGLIPETQPLRAFAKIKVTHMTPQGFFCILFTAFSILQSQIRQNKCKEKIQRKTLTFSMFTYPAAAPNIVLRLQRLIKYTPALTFIHTHTLTQEFLEHFPNLLHSLLSHGYELSKLSDIDKLDFL